MEISTRFHYLNLRANPSTTSASVSTPETQIIVSPSTPPPPDMEKRRRVELAFSQMLTTRQAEGHSDNEAWRHALIQWHQERGEHAAASTLATATISPEIPLADSILGPMPAPPAGAPNPAINAAGENHILAACKPDDPRAQERIMGNTKRLVECGIVDKLRSLPGAGYSSQRCVPSDTPEDDSEVDCFAHIRDAHIRYLGAMHDMERMLRERDTRRAAGSHRVPGSRHGYIYRRGPVPHRGPGGL